TVEVNQILVEVETAKAAVELPSPWAGVVTALHANEGDTVDVGKPIISIDAAPGSSGAPAAAETADAGTEEAVAGTDAYGVVGEGAPKRQPVLVGYGPRDDSLGRRRRRGGVATPPPAEEPVAQAAEPTAEP